MYCAKCRTEYIEGTVKCDDCGSELVNELPEEAQDIGDLVDIFTTNNSIEANFIKSLLGSNSIGCTIINEHLVSINIFLSNAIPIKVAVDKNHEARAREVIDQYYKDLRERK